MLLTNKYQPKTLKEILGNDNAILNLRNSINGKKPNLIYGSVGTCKTSAIYALANELNYEILEVNASESLHKDVIESVVKSAAQQQSLFHQGKIILVDGIDGLSGRTDYGGLPALNRLLKDSSFPVVFICNDPWNSKFSTLRRKCNLIEFKMLEVNTLITILKTVCNKENVEYDEKILQSISENCNGDLRAALNDLQVVIMDGKFQDVTLERRERQEGILKGLQDLFSGKGTNEDILINLDVDLNEIKLWVEENLPLVYNGEDLVKSFDYLSKSEVFAGRIMRNQYFRFLVYQSSLLRFGMPAKNLGYVNYKRNDRILQMWIGKRRYSEKNELAKVIGEKISCSKHKAMLELPYLGKVLQDKEIQDSLFA